MGILQARILKWVALPSSRESFQPRNQTQVSLIVDRHSRQRVKKQRLHFVDKGLYRQGCSFSRSHVWMWQLDYKEGWVPNWCFRNVVLKKTLESSLDSKEIKPVNPKGNQPWIFTGKTDAKREAPILWPPDVMDWLTGKDLDAGKIEGRRWREQQRMKWLDDIADSMDMSFSQLCEMVEDGSLVCYSPWGRKESDMT